MYLLFYITHIINVYTIFVFLISSTVLIQLVFVLSVRYNGRHQFQFLNVCSIHYIYHFIRLVQLLFIYSQILYFIDVIMPTDKNIVVLLIFNFFFNNSNFINMYINDYHGINKKKFFMAKHQFLTLYSIYLSSIIIFRYRHIYL